MKTLLLTYLFCLIIAPNASATGATAIYPVKFEYKSKQAICPKDQYGFGCKALGIIVKLETTLSTCSDKIIDFSYESYLYDNKLNIDVYANAERQAGADCNKQITITKEITVLYETFENVVLNNVSYDYFK